MSRPPRFIVPGLPQHVIVRGNNRDPIFGSDDDYSAYLDWLEKAKEKHGCDIHAYVLMTNHVHLLVTPSTDRGLSLMIQMVGRYYVQSFKHRYRRTGTLWEGRFKASLVDSEHYLLTCSRYIELNPVCAGMASHPGEYPWSSYRWNALGHTDRVLTPHELYMALGSDNADRQQGYLELFKDHIPARTLEEIRDASNKGWVLGSPHFIRRIEARLKRSAQKRARGGDHKSKTFRETASINCISRDLM